MLLPSALPCDLFAPRPEPLRRSTRLSPPPDTLSTTTTSLLTTCRRLQTILSIPASTAKSTTSAPTSTSSSSSSTPKRRLLPPASRASSPRTPLRPRGANKRTRTESGDSHPDPRSLCTPPKRQRLTTPPPPPDRGPAREVWTEEEDRRLAQMVLGRGDLSLREWEECARKLGKRDARAVGRRWEGLIGAVAPRRARAGVVRRLRR